MRNLLLFIFLLPLTALAQTQRKPNLHDEGGGFSVAFAGGGSDAHLGGAMGFYDTSTFRGWLPTGGFLEAGVVMPGGRHGADGFFSVNHLSVFSFKENPRVLPFATVGYSRLGAGNAVNYGGGMMYRYGKPKYGVSDVRVEYRDYYVPSNGHTYAIRLGWGFTSAP